MPGLKLWLFGPPRIELEDEPVELPRRKSLALLVYLALAGEAQPRDRLAALFYPEYDQGGARSALRRDLATLNASLGPGWLDASRESIALRRDVDSPAGRLPADCFDIERFHDLLAACDRHDHQGAAVCPSCLSLLGEAAGLHRGDFLAGFTLKDSPEFDEWQFFKAESLRQELAAALERLASGYDALGGSEAAPGIPYARQWVALDPLHEPAHRQLMQLYARTGRPAAALRQYAECVRILDAELGVRPAEETTRLYEAIKEQRLHKEAPAVDPRPRQGPAVRGRDPDLALEPAGTPNLEGAQPGEIERPTFAGHESELARLDHFLGLALGGQSQAVFVIGEAGSGKTVLVQEFARRSQAQRPDLVVAWGYCNAYTGLGDPYLPFREILSHLTGDAEVLSLGGSSARLAAQPMQAFVSRAIQVLVETGPDLLDTFVSRRSLVGRFDGATQEPDGLKALLASQEARQSSGNVKQADLFEQYVRVVQVLAGQQPLMLVLDDLQWADAGSINLLLDLGRRLRGARILIVGMYRPAEVALGRASTARRADDGVPGTEWERHPLESLVNEFQRQFGDIILDLGQTADRHFVDAFLDAQPNVLEPGFREALFRHTAGHALFTVEMFRGMQERGDIVKDERGRWVEARELNWEILPARVEGVIGERIGRLPPVLRELLKVASVEGEIFTAEVVARVQGSEERAVVRLLSGELDRGHRLVRNESSRRLSPDDQQVSQYRFRHILFQKYLYHELDDAECTYLHEAVGLVLERLYGGNTDAVSVQLARHFEAAGWPAKAVRYLKQAGERAVRLSANEEALVHITRALQLLAGMPPSTETLRQELDLQIALFAPLVAVKGYGTPEVGQAYTRARELCMQIEDPASLFQVLYGLWGYNLVRMNLDTSLELARECLALAEASQNRALLLEGNRIMGETAYHRGEVVQAREYFERSRTLYDPRQHRVHAAVYGQDPGVALLSHGSFTLWHLGYADQAAAWSQEAMALAEEGQHPFSQVFSLDYAGILHELRGEPDAAGERIAGAMAISEEQKFAFWLGRLRALHGWLSVQQAPLAEGIAQGIAEMRENLAAYRATGAELFVAYYLICLAKAYARSGDLGAAQGALDEGLAEVARSAGRLWEAELYRVKGELLLTGVRLEEKAAAEACFLKALTVAREQQARSLELRAAMSLCRLWEQSGRKAEARVLLTETHGWFTEGFDTADLREAVALLATFA